MSSITRQWIPLVALVLACQAPGAFAQSAPRVDERLDADALNYFRHARFPEAYGRFVARANAGHAPSAAVALWMYRNGPSLFGSRWDASSEQLAAWTQLARQPVPSEVERAHPQPLPSPSANANEAEETGT